MKRFKSLDIFRGLTLAAMIIVNNPGNYHQVYAQLEHSPWNGCTLTDLIFPFFLFAVGNSMAFSMKNINEISAIAFCKKVGKRFFLLFMLGFLLNIFPFVEWSNQHELVWISIEKYRYFGVLQRIALCYFCSSLLIYFLSEKGAIITAAFLLLLYWILCYVTHPTDPYSLQGWYGIAIDRRLFGSSHLYHGEGIAFDPESIWSSFVPVSQTIFGYAAGKYIMNKLRGKEELLRLLGIGVVCIVIGYAWSLLFPFNKKIWTSSYGLFSTGIALSVLSLLIYLIEFQKITSYWYSLLDDLGKNTLFIYCISRIVPELCALVRIPTTKQNLWDYSYQLLFGSWANQKFASLLFAIIFLLLHCSLAALLRRKKIYIKI